MSLMTANLLVALSIFGPAYLGSLIPARRSPDGGCRSRARPGPHGPVADAA